MIMILPSFTPILTLNFLQCEKNEFPPLKPTVNTFITTLILTFVTNGKKCLNFVQVLIRKPTMDAKYNYGKYLHIGSEFSRTGSSTFLLCEISS